MLEPPITPDEVQGAPRRTGRFWFDFIAACAAIFISLMSLVIAVRNQQTESKLLAANAWPFLQVENNFSTHGNATLTIVNAGVGPAKLVTYGLTYNGQPVDSMLALLERCCGVPADPELRHKQLPEGFAYGTDEGAVVRPGDRVQLLTLGQTPLAPAIRQSFDREYAHVDYIACYCSILDECWVSTLRTLNPRAVATCPVLAHPLIEEHP